MAATTVLLAARVIAPGDHTVHRPFPVTASRTVDGTTVVTYSDNVQEAHVATSLVSIHKIGS